MNYPEDYITTITERGLMIKSKTIKGIQVSADKQVFTIRGKRTVDYYRGNVEFTVDTDIGNRIITEKDLLDYINAKTV